MKIIEVRPNGKKRVATINDEPSRTQQQFKDDVDVNRIMAKYRKTGSVTHLRNVQMGVYADLSEITDLAESMMKVKRAEEAFSEIPSEIRMRFQNDPTLLIQFLRDPKNKKEAMELGLIKTEPLSEPMETPKSDKP